MGSFNVFTCIHACNSIIYKVLALINNPLSKLQFSLWDLIWYMHVTFMLHYQHEYIIVPCTYVTPILMLHACEMHITITVTCMSYKHMVQACWFTIYMYFQTFLSKLFHRSHPTIFWHLFSNLKSLIVSWTRPLYSGNALIDWRL